MILTEPATFATDLALAGMSAYFARNLLRVGRERGSTPVLLWGAGFAGLAGAALLGAIEHGFGPAGGGVFDAILWRATIVVLCAAAGLLLMAALHAGVGPPQQERAVRLGGTIVGGAIIPVALRGDFLGALAVYGVCLLAVLGILLVSPRCRSGSARWWALGGVLVSALAGWIQVAGPDLHPSFNHNDLYHVVQAPGLWLLYRGGIDLGSSG